MSVRSRLFGLALALVLLAGCGQEDEPANGLAAMVSPGATAVAAAATPTLMPGLPTSTPWRSWEPTATLAPTATPTPSPTPTPTPLPGERLNLGESLLQNEDYAGAAEQFQAGLLTDELTDAQRQAALLGLGQARLAEGQHAAADEALGALLAGAATSAEGSANEAAGEEGTAGVAEAYYFQAQSYEAQGNCGAAIGAYEAYLQHDDALTAYVKARIGECFLALGDKPSAVTAYEAAVAAEAQPDVSLANRYRLATLYEEDGDFEGALAQYETVLATAEDEKTLGQATYLAGTAELLAGDAEAAYARYMLGVEQYPRAYESYLGLMALVDAGYEINDFQRGLVDYYAKAYEPAVTVLSRYLDASPDHNEEAHLYLAWSLENLGNLEAALRQLQAYIDVYRPAVQESQATPPAGTPQATPGAADEPDPAAVAAAAKGTLELAKMLARAGRLDEAAERYAEYVTLYPGGADGPLAAWWSAAFAEREGDEQQAIERYELLAELYPQHDDADEALFRAGFVAHQSGDEVTGRRLWELAATLYPEDDYGAAAMLWLLRTLGEEERQAWLARAEDVQGSTYYPLRLGDIVSDTAPFEAPEAVDLILSTRDRAAAESWLLDKLALESSGVLGRLPNDLAGDGRLQRGQALWRLGQRQAAKAELESLRREVAQDPLASYRLALFFRDLGLYRSSILAAAAVMHELEVDVFDAPRFIAGLAYPTYYADLITAEADRYGYDPLLQFSLVRQESLFESFATSGAVAQGLSQVIPDTGAYIAQRLNWPDYVNEDLYRPYVGIAFGAYYLNQQLDAFDGDVAAALSAYNGGPGNAARWYALAGGDIDLYLETVDFSETRQYIERIYAGQAIYRHLYGQPAPEPAS
jgi:soluble lytic murein transglycosylase